VVVKLAVILYFFTPKAWIACANSGLTRASKEDRVNVGIEGWGPGGQVARIGVTVL